MKLNLLTGITVAATLAFASCNNSTETAQAGAITTEIDSVSYALGVNVASSVKQSGLDTINPALVAKAFEDVMSAGTLTIDNEAGQQILQNYFQRLSMKKMNQSKEKGEAFLADNAKQAGVITTESGLQYSVVTEGTGAKPTITDEVKVHYHGTLIDGTVFDSSVERGEPISFPVSGVIPGWTEALQLMSIGSKYKLFIPYQLAYGERGAGQQIGPYSTLIFEVELLDIVKK